MKKPVVLAVTAIVAIVVASVVVARFGMSREEIRVGRISPLTGDEAH